jgi:hypothetical protein
MSSLYPQEGVALKLSLEDKKTNRKNHFLIIWDNNSGAVEIFIITDKKLF